MLNFIVLCEIISFIQIWRQMERFLLNFCLLSPATLRFPPMGVHVAISQNCILKLIYKIVYIYSPSPLAQDQACIKNNAKIGRVSENGMDYWPSL